MGVEAWCIGVERMNRRQLDRFTRDIWRRFDHRDLEPLRWAWWAEVVEMGSFRHPGSTRIA
jgi:hypothetical protein